MPPPPMPSPDVAQYASSSAFSSMWGMFSSSSVCAVCFRFPYLSCSQILLSAGEVGKTKTKTHIYSCKAQLCAVCFVCAVCFRFPYLSCSQIHIFIHV